MLACRNGASLVPLAGIFHMSSMRMICASVHASSRCSWMSTRTSLLILCSTPAESATMVARYALLHNTTSLTSTCRFYASPSPSPRSLPHSPCSFVQSPCHVEDCAIVSSFLHVTGRHCLAPHDCVVWSVLLARSFANIFDNALHGKWLCCLNSCCWSLSGFC